MGFMLPGTISDPASPIMHLRGKVVARMEALVGWEDRSKKKGLMSSVAIAAFFCFHWLEKLPDSPGKVALGWVERLRKAVRGYKIVTKFKVTNMLPPLHMAPQAQGSHDATLQPTQTQSEAPSPWLSSFQHWHGKDTSLTHTHPRVPTRTQRWLHSLPFPHLKVSVGSTWRAAMS